MTGLATDRITLFRPLVRDEAVVAVAEVLRSGWLGPGPQVIEFERAFAARSGSPHCVTVANGTAALRLALHVLDLPAGTEVITTPLTFVAANQAILHARLTPVFADVQPDTGNLDPASVAERITARTGALVLMHYGGMPCDLHELYALAAEHGLRVVEDCAHACGSVYRGRPIGAHGELHAFSFGAIKTLPIGEGGALTLASPELDARLRRLRNAGIMADAHTRAASGGHTWDYGVEELGFRCALGDVAAAIGLVQLTHLDEDNARRSELAARYRAGLGSVPGLELTREHDDRESAHHLFPVLADRRDDLVRRLREHGVDTGVYYRPSYDHPPFRGEPLPGVESFWRRVVCLPLHLGLADDDLDRVVELVRQGW